MDAKSLTTCEVDINSDGYTIKKEIKIEPDEYSENFKQSYVELECPYPEISSSESDPLNVDCKQEIQENSGKKIIKSEVVESNVCEEINKNVLDASTLDLPVGGGTIVCTTN